MTGALRYRPHVTREPIPAVAVGVPSLASQLLSLPVSVLSFALFNTSPGRANRRVRKLGTLGAVLRAYIICVRRDKRPHRAGVLTRASILPGTGVPRAGREGGQGLVEFALILPILLLTVLLFLYFAQLFNTWSGLQAGAVAGARQASDSGSVVKVEEVVRETLHAYAIDPTDVEVTTTVLDPDGSPKICWVEPCPVEFGDLVLVEVVKPFEIRVLGWQAEGKLPASHQVRAQHGVWLP